MVPLKKVISLTEEGQAPIYVVLDKVVTFGTTKDNEGKPAFYMYTTLARQYWNSPVINAPQGHFSQVELNSQAEYEPDIFISCKTEKEAHRLLERVLRAIEGSKEDRYYRKGGYNNGQLS